MKYIDVSEWQGVIDWGKVKGNVDGVIIRAGYGSRGTPDKRFTYNASECNRLHIPCGAYWFSYAKSTEEQATFSLSGRNTIGYRLNQQTFDDETEFEGDGNQVVAWIFARAGITNYAIAPSTASMVWTFKPSDTLYAGLQKVFEVFPGWGMEELPDGKITVGYAYWRQQYQANSVYQYVLGEDVIKRRVRKSADAAYSHVRVTGKDAAGAELEPVYLPVDTFRHWALGTTKTKHVTAADGLTQEQLRSFAEQTAADLAYIGVGETFSSPMRPWLLCGDVASISADGVTSEDIGLITSITHRFGDRGFFTDFSVDSGGSAEIRTMDAVTRTASVRGYNRSQNLADLIGVIAADNRRS